MFKDSQPNQKNVIVNFGDLSDSELGNYFRKKILDTGLTGKKETINKFVDLAVKDRKNVASEAEKEQLRKMKEKLFLP